MLVGVVVAVDGGNATMVGCACEGMGTIVGVLGMELLATVDGAAGGIEATVA